MPPQAAKWAECSSGTPTLPYNAATIDLLRRGTALSGDTTMLHGGCQNVQQGLEHTGCGPSERAAQT